MQGAAMQWTEVGRIADIPRRGARCVDTPRGRIAIVRTVDDQVFAIADRCPHKGGPLSQGIVHDASITCPLHNMVVSLETGEARAPDEGRVRTWPIKVEHGRILLSVGPDAAGRAA